MTVYCLSGYPGSGKSAVAQIMGENRAQIISMGDQIRDRIPENSSYKHTGDFANEQREKHGKDIVAKWTETEIKDTEEETVVIEGVRSRDELKYFDSAIDGFELVVVTAPDEVRLERLRDRGRESESGFDMAKLKERDKREESWGLKELVNSGEYTEIENDFDELSKLEEQVSSKLLS
jgi:dephospho-CoA kinase